MKYNLEATKLQSNLEEKVAGVGDRGESPIQGPRKLLSPKVEILIFGKLQKKNTLIR